MVFLDPIRNSTLGIRLRRLELARVWAIRPTLLFGLSAFTLVASLMLGGGTRGGFLSDSILELIAIPALFVAASSLFAMPWRNRKRGTEWALTLCMGIAILPLIQLIPLPPWIWTNLPHREQITAVFDLLNHDLPWLPISVAPSLTWASVLSLIPPFAVFLGVIQLNYRERRIMSLILIAVGIVDAFLGLLQVAQGPSSPWRFFAVTNNTDAVGFFANRNHLAALLYSVLLFGAAWAIEIAYSVESWSDRRSLQSKSIVLLAGSFLGLVILIAAEASSRSRAGLGLLIVALFGAMALALKDRRWSSGASPIKLILASALVALVLVVQFALYRVLDRFEDPLHGARLEFAHNTIAAAEAYMPFGSGFGTFVAVYPQFEPPQDVFDNKFVNHAHDDLLEVWLEGGIGSLILVTAFALWLFFATAKTWWNPPASTRRIDILLARAATIAIPLIMAHSVVDYPLRTDAMMAVLALCCAFLIEPPGVAAIDHERRVAFVPEISEEELLRLARIRAGGTGERPPPELEALPQPLVDQAEDAALVQSVMADAVKDEALMDHRPIDPDEIADLLERQRLLGGDAPAETTDEPLLDAKEETTDPEAMLEDASMESADVDAGETTGLEAMPEDALTESSDLDAEETTELEAMSEDASMESPDLEGGAGIADHPGEPHESYSDEHTEDAAVEARSEDIGEVAYELAKLNQLSTVLIARSESGAMRGDETAASGDFDHESGRKLAEAAQRKLRIFRSVMLAPSSASAKTSAAARTPISGRASASTSARTLTPARASRLARAQPPAPAQASVPVQASAQPADQGSKSPDKAAIASVTMRKRPFETAQPKTKIFHSVERFVELAQSIDTPIARVESDGVEAVKPPSQPEDLSMSQQQPPIVEPVAPVEIVNARAEPDLFALLGVSEALPEEQASVDAPVSGVTEPPQELGVTELPQEPAVTESLQELEVTELPQEPETEAQREPEVTESPQEQWGDHQVEWPEQWQNGSANSDGEQRATNEEMSDGSAPENTRQTPEEFAPPLTPAERPIAPTRPRPDARSHAAKTSAPPALPETARWGDDIEWPEEWR